MAQRVSSPGEQLDINPADPERSESDATLYAKDSKDDFAQEEARPTMEVKADTPFVYSEDIQGAPHVRFEPKSGLSSNIGNVPLDPESSAEESSSDEENDETRQRSMSHPESDSLSTSQLNQVKQHTGIPLTKRMRRARKLTVANEHFKSCGRVARDGRLKISVSETANSGYLAKALGATISRHLHPQQRQTSKASEEETVSINETQTPSMNIVIMVIGSRGDIQPFLKIGQILRDKYHHRVRIATHPTFKKFVEEDIGLEFFSVGGDPAELMAFMVKNPGLIPTFESVKAGEIGRRRDSMYEMFQGFWRACINATDDEKDEANLKMMREKYPFVADAIIANPPSFAHYHCAEKLNIPLHLVFTFPYTPTQSFPHPLANIKAANVDQSYTNYMSYPLVDLMTWQGLGDLVNKFRVKTLDLEPVSTLWAPGQLSRLKVPTTYLWSPGLVPKPEDWGPEITIAGYVFLDLASSFKPPEDLTCFLDRSDGKPIVYIGFGSIAGVDDAVKFTKMVFDAVEKAEVKAVVSKGWGSMGEGIEKPKDVFLVDNVPHDWLFPKVDAVVHHGGAGTTAAGLKFGKPTMIIPFFGDQPFWSAMVSKAGAGAKEALPLKKLNSDKFAEGIKQCLGSSAREKAQDIAKAIEAEGDGAQNAIDAFHRSLPLTGRHSMKCCIFPDRVAVWHVKRNDMHLSALAAELLIQINQLQWTDLSLMKRFEWIDFHGPGEPVTGAGGVLVAAFNEAFRGIASIPENTRHDIQAYERRKRRKKGMVVSDAVVLPGRIAFATKGGSAENSRAERAKLDAEINFRGHKFSSDLPNISQNDELPTRELLSKTFSNSSDVQPPVVAFMKDLGHGLGHSSRVMFNLPIEFWHAVTLGFRNAPRLYGDDTVRPPPHSITGFRSGIKTAGSELWLGFYDGFTGVIMIPYNAAHQRGVASLPLAFAHGIGGLVLKPTSGILGLGGYSGKGMQASLRRKFRHTQDSEAWIRRARMAQGVKDVNALKEQTIEFEKARTTALTFWKSRGKVELKVQQ